MPQFIFFPREALPAYSVNKYMKKKTKNLYKRRLLNALFKWVLSITMLDYQLY